MKRFQLACGVAIAGALLAAPGARAQEVIFDAAPNNDLPAFVDQQFADFPDFSTYLLACVTIERDTFIHDVTTYYTNANNLWPQGQIEAVLNITRQDNGLPPNDYDPGGPQVGGAGLKVLADMSANGDRLSLTAHLDGGITLEAGKYWIGLTPKLDFGMFGQEFHKGSDFFEKNTAGRNPGGGFGVGTDWFDAGLVFGGVDWGMALTITGKNVPTPGALALLGIAGLLVTGRRRR